MISLKHLIQEIYSNLHSRNEKLPYVDITTDLIYKSYASVGGFKSLDDKNELRDEIEWQANKDDTFWKLSKRHGEVTSIIIYKNTPSGMRTVASATDKTEQGKIDLLKMKRDDLQQKRSFSEVSDAMEHIMLKMGAKKYPFEVVKRILNKNSDGVELIPDDDGYHYYRVINGKLKRKLLVGFVKQT